MAASPVLKQASKCSTGLFLSPKYSRKQIISFLSEVVLHYILFSGLPESLKFPIETTGEVSVTCMLSFSHEASIKFTISLHELHIDLHELHIGIFISIL